MSKDFCNEDAEILYKRIISLNKDLMEDKDSISLGIHNIVNEGSLIHVCNLVYDTIPFTDPPEPYCKDFAEMTARLIYNLNTGHCFSDGNKRTTLLIIMELIKEAYPIFYNEFFRGSLSNFLIGMLSERLNYENILDWVYKQYELRYDISDEEESLLKIAVNLKRAGLYEEAMEKYINLIEKYGNSSVVYKAIAKVLACDGQYEEAIEMFDKAIKLAIEDNIIDEQSIYHKEMLESRSSISSIKFLHYMKSISGNPDFVFK